MDDKEIKAHHKGIRDGYEMALEDAAKVVEETGPDKLTWKTIMDALRDGFDELEEGG